MNTKNKHKKRAVFLLFLSAFILLRLGWEIALLTHFFPDSRAMDFHTMHPGVPFPKDLQMQLTISQSPWYMFGLSFLLMLPLVYIIAKRLLFIKPFRSSIITLLFIYLLYLFMYYYAS